MLKQTFFEEVTFSGICLALLFLEYPISVCRVEMEKDPVQGKWGDVGESILSENLNLALPLGVCPEGESDLLTNDYF